jgi:hypothetical protein
MAEPYFMGTATWGTPPTPPAVNASVDSLTTWSLSKSGALLSQTSTFSAGATVAVRTHVIDANNVPISGCQVFMNIRSSTGTLITSLQGFTDNTGYAVAKWSTSRNQAGKYTANVTDIIKSGYVFSPTTSVTSANITLQ